MKVRLKQYAFCIKFRVYFPIIIHLLLVFQSPWRFFSCWHLSVLYQCKYIANVIIVSTCKDQYFMYFRSGDESYKKQILGLSSFLKCIGCSYSIYIYIYFFLPKITFKTILTLSKKQKNKIKNTLYFTFLAQIDSG